VAGKKHLRIHEQAGVEQMLSGVGQRIMREELAGSKAGDCEELGVSIGGSALEDDVRDRVLGARGCGSDGQNEEEWCGESSAKRHGVARVVGGMSIGNFCRWIVMGDDEFKR
jgi:hypothetical protein